MKNAQQANRSSRRRRTKAKIRSPMARQKSGLCENAQNFYGGQNLAHYLNFNSDDSRGRRARRRKQIVSRFIPVLPETVTYETIASTPPKIDPVNCGGLDPRFQGQLPRELTSEERTILGHTIHQARHGNNGKTPYGLVKKMSADYRVSRRTVTNIASLFQKGVDFHDMRVMRSGSRSGRPRKVTPAILSQLTEYAQDMAFDFSWDEAAQHLGGLDHDTLRRAAMSSGWRIVFGRTIPTLTDEQKKARLTWAQKYRHQLWDDWVDIDEKWFFVYVKRKKKVPPGVSAPATKVQSRRFIGKTMFLAAVGQSTILTAELESGGSARRVLL